MLILSLAWASEVILSIGVQTKATAFSHLIKKLVGGRVFSNTNKLTRMHSSGGAINTRAHGRVSMNRIDPNSFVRVHNVVASRHSNCQVHMNLWAFVSPV